MTTAAEYLRKNRKDIKLPSGLEIKIKSLVLEDLKEAGDVPIAFLEGKGVPAQKDVKFFSALVKAILIHCVVGPADFKPVDKSPRDADASKGEISISDISREDSDFIVAEALALSEMTKEAAAKAKPFPAEPEVPGAGGHDREAIRENAA